MKIDRSTPPPVHELDPRPMPPQHVEVLPNGLTLHTFSGGDQPVCQFTIAFEGGASELGNDLISRMMLNGLTDGTTRYSTDELSDLIDFNGVKASSACHSHYSTLTFAVLSHRLGEVLRLVADMLASPTFPQERIDTMRLSAKAQMETSRNEPAVLAEEAARKMMMGDDHPLADVMTPENIMAITRDDILGLHRRMTAPGHVHIYLCGLLDDEILQKVRSFGENFPALGSGIATSIIPFVSAPAGTRLDIAGPDSMQSAVNLSLPAIPRSHPDYNDLRLAVMALGGYFGSRLMRNIREDKGLTYGISASLQGMSEGSMSKISARCDRTFTSRVLEEIEIELRRMVSDPPAGEELEALRRYAYTTLASQLDTPITIMNYYTTALMVDMPADYFEAQQRAARALTPDRLAEVSAKYLSPEQLRTVVVGI